MSEENAPLGLEEHEQDRVVNQEDRFDQENFGGENPDQIDYPPMPDQPSHYGYYDDEMDRLDHPSNPDDVPVSDNATYGKIFVGGISWQTSENNLRHHFEKYGDLDDVALMTDKRTGQPRGFGFVTFKDLSVVDVVLQQEHVIDGRTVDVKRAVPKDEAPAPTRLESKKVFVGGLGSSVTETEFREYFEAYGPVKEAIVMYDRQTNRSRGFGFITFEQEESVNKVMKDKQHEIMGKFVEVKRAEPRDARSSSGGGGGGGSDRDDMYPQMRYPGMYPGQMRYPYPYGGRGGQYPAFPGMGFYPGFPSFGMGAGPYGGRSMYAYGGGGRGGSGGGPQSGGMGPGPGNMPQREGSSERGGSSSREGPSSSERSGSRGRSSGGPSSGGAQGYGNYRMMPMYGYGYGGYGMYQRPSDEAAYGPMRGQGAEAARAGRAFRPY